MEIFTPIRISRNKTEDLQNIIDHLVGKIIVEKDGNYDKVY